MTPRCHITESHSSGIAALRAGKAAYVRCSLLDCVVCCRCGDAISAMKRRWQTTDKHRREARTCTRFFVVYCTSSKWVGRVFGGQRFI